MCDDEIATVINELIAKQGWRIRPTNDTHKSWIAERFNENGIVLASATLPNRRMAIHWLMGCIGSRDLEKFKDI